MAEYISGLMENAANLDWGLIMSTLVIRFVGVFLVLFVVMIGMMILGKVVSTMVARQEARESDEQANEPPALAPALAPAEEPELKIAEEEVVAAIGAALAVVMEQGGRIGAMAAPAGAETGPWASLGRTAQMSARMPGGPHRRV